MRRVLLITGALLAGCASFSTYRGADTVEQGRVEFLACPYLVWGWYKDSIVGNAASRWPFGLQLGVNYGLMDRIDLGLRLAGDAVSGDVRACVYRSRERRKTPYWAITTQLGALKRPNDEAPFSTIEAVENLIIYPGIGFGSVGRNLEGSLMVNYYYSKYYTSDPIADAHLGLSGGLRFKAGPWKRYFPKSFFSTYEITVISGRFNGRWGLSLFQLGTGVGFVF